MRSPSKIRRIAIAIALATTAARAEAPRLESPGDEPGCPSEDDLRRAVVAQLGREVPEDAPTIVVRVRRLEDGTLAAEVVSTTLDGRTSTRTIRDPGGTCADLVRAAALTIALAIEREAAARKPEPPPPPPLPVVPRETPAPPRLLREDHLVATASALTAIGLLPRPAAGAGLSVRGRVSEALWLSARGIWLPEGAMPNEAFALSLLAGGAGACVEPFSSGSVSAVGCGHLVVGSLDVARASIPMESDRAKAYVAASLSFGARARLVGPIHFEALADAHLPFTRPTFLTAACPQVGFEPPFVALAAWLGAGVSIP